MKIYLNNLNKLIPKVRGFYQKSFDKYKQAGKKIPKRVFTIHSNEIISFLRRTELDIDITQPTFNEWIDKGYKQFKHNRWFFAVEYILMEDGEGRWITIDCHHESKNHNDDIVNEWRNFPEIQAILDLEQRMDNL